MSFSKPKAPPTPAPVAPAPTVDDAIVNRDRNDAMRRRKGRAATIFAGKRKSDKVVGAATKTLTGE